MNETLNTGAAVARLLRQELDGHGSVAALGNQVIIQISRTDFEQHLGNLLQQIYRVVDQHFPDREEHLLLIIRDRDGRLENTFKQRASHQTI